VGRPLGGARALPLTLTLALTTDPNQVAHVQFRSRIAFKLVWVPPALETFVLVDDAGGPYKAVLIRARVRRPWLGLGLGGTVHGRSGRRGRKVCRLRLPLRLSRGAPGAGELLNSGTPTGRLPALSQRQQNFALVRGSKYAAAAEALGKAA